MENAERFPEVLETKIKRLQRMIAKFDLIIINDEKLFGTFMKGEEGIRAIMLWVIGVLFSADAFFIKLLIDAKRFSFILQHKSTSCLGIGAVLCLAIIFIFYYHAIQNVMTLNTRRFVTAKEIIHARNVFLSNPEEMSEDESVFQDDQLHELTKRAGQSIFALKFIRCLFFAMSSVVMVFSGWLFFQYMAQ